MYFGKDIDDDYIDVEKQRADISTTDKEPSTADDQPVDMSHIFDRGSGNGAASQIEEQIDDKAVIENDGRSKTRTFFYPEEAADSAEQQYSRMIRWQDGEGDSQRDVENRAADRRRAISTFCAHLDMSPYHKDRVEHIVEGINMSHMAHYSSPKVILAIVSLVANADGWMVRDNAQFQTLVDDVGSDMKEIKNIRGLVRDKSDRL